MRLVRNCSNFVQRLSPGCGMRWCYFKGFCYLPVTKQTLNYQGAENFCKERQGYLTEIQTEEENEFVASLTLPLKSNVWIGYNDRAREGKWIWTNTGENGNYSNWNTAQPDDHEKQDCAILWTGGGRKVWDDIGCDFNQWFVCEKGNATQ